MSSTTVNLDWFDAAKVECEACHQQAAYRLPCDHLFLPCQACGGKVAIVELGVRKRRPRQA